VKVIEMEPGGKIKVSRKALLERGPGDGDGDDRRGRSPDRGGRAGGRNRSSDRGRRDSGSREAAPPDGGASRHSSGGAYYRDKRG